MRTITDETAAVAASQPPVLGGGPAGYTPPGPPPWHSGLHRTVTCDSDLDRRESENKPQAGHGTHRVRPAARMYRDARMFSL